MSVDVIVSCVSIAAEALCLVSFMVAGYRRKLPWFTAYLAYLVAAESCGVLCFLTSARAYWYCFVGICVPCYLLEGFVMRELLRAKAGWFGVPMRRAVNLLLPAASVLLIPFAFWLARGASYHGLRSVVQLLLRADLAFATYRVLIFLGIVYATKILFIGERDIIDDVAVGLSIYAVVALLAGIIHEYAGRGALRPDIFANVEQARILCWAATTTFLTYRAFAYSGRRRPLALTTESV